MSLHFNSLQSLLLVTEIEEGARILKKKFALTQYVENGRPSTSKTIFTQQRSYRKCHHYSCLSPWNKIKEVKIHKITIIL